MGVVLLPSLQMCLFIFFFLDLAPMNRFRMFIDDTGSVHNPTTNHPQQRFGGIVGVVFDLDYLRDVFEPEFDRLREYFFGRLPKGSLPILHLRKMKKADPRGSFSKL